MIGRRIHQVVRHAVPLELRGHHLVVGQRPPGPPLRVPGCARPGFDADQLKDFVFVTVGVTPHACLCIALQRPTNSDRDAMAVLTPRTLATALTPQQP
ncbi:MAG: hypothetical protein K0Q61_3797 [Rhodococcus erythropolis]|nr:hypothetical protein [Rhodococcus erythropolis]